MNINKGLILAILAGFAARAAGQDGSHCRPADAYTAELLPYLDTLVTQPGDSYAGFRKQLQLRLTASGNVALVTTEAICAQAATKVNAVLKTPGTERRVYVFKLGPARYAVSDPTDTPLPKGERVMLFFTNAFVYLSRVNH